MKLELAIIDYRCHFPRISHFDVFVIQMATNEDQTIRMIGVVQIVKDHGRLLKENQH